MNLFIIDLEATCHQKNPPRNFFSEIIEIGGVIFDTQTHSIVKEYQQFVQPVLFPILSEFCTELTSISQEQVDQGISFVDAIPNLKKLSSKYQTIFCSWGHYDRKQLKQQCQRFHVDYPFSTKHINLKEAHSDFYQVRKMGMKGAMYHLKLELEGTHHRGMDDARNISKIVKQMLTDGWSWEDSIQQYLA
ncbi:exonuclease domain-containing protein [Shimazuella sp. AN120528]|uniref:3'-5' exonuclease n=1 Tax=Shimazuella soli TaxID=1892854 RepID=UPI001F0DB3C2|nr:3'-5' exonuclease [Shimazuella soli]MCH5586004.1 exonuclease domain-containing protein [Shimazuella soli]